MVHRRSITDVLPSRELDHRSNVLVAGPTADTVDGVSRAVVATGATPGDGGVVVSTRQPPRMVADRLAPVEAIGRDRMGVVDCTPKSGGMAVTDGGLCWRVASPSDLTGIGIALTESFDALARRGVDRTHLLFDSLSTPLIAIDDGSVFEFAHQLTYQRGYPSGLAVFPMYTNTTTDRDLERLKHLVDGLIEVRKRRGERQVRYQGFEGSPDGWTTLSVPGGDPAASLSD